LRQRGRNTLRGSTTLTSLHHGPLTKKRGHHYAESVISEHHPRATLQNSTAAIFCRVAPILCTPPAQDTHHLAEESTAKSLSRPAVGKISDRMPPFDGLVFIQNFRLCQNNFRNMSFDHQIPPLFLPLFALLPSTFPYPYPFPISSHSSPPWISTLPVKSHEIHP